MTPASDIWLADLVRAVTALRPATEGVAGNIAAALGLEGGRRRARAQDAAGPPEGGLRSVPQSIEPPSREPPPPLQPRRDLPRLPQNTVLRPTRWERADPGERWRTVEELERPQPTTAVSQLRHDPLFDPRWQRELAVALAAQRLPYGPIDAPRVVAQAARGQPVTRISHVRRWSVNRGLQLLVDLGLGSEPFRRDQSTFTAFLKATLSRERVSVASFWGCPSRGISGEESDEQPYRPPSPGVPVLVLSDLGFADGDRAGSGAPAAEWVAFAGALLRQDSRVVALATREKASFPSAITRAYTIIPWRAETTLRTVQEALGRS